MLPAASTSQLSGAPINGQSESMVPSITSLRQLARTAGSPNVLPFTGVANGPGAPINTARLRGQMASLGMRIGTLSKLTRLPVNSLHRWVSGRGDAPWGAVERISAAVGLTPERLAPKPKVFDSRRFSYYMAQRSVSLEKLVVEGRFKPYAYSSVAKWRRGVTMPSLQAVRVLEQGLALKTDALTDGPLEEVPAFTPAEIAQWSAPDPTVDGDVGLTPCIRDVLRNWRRDQGLSWGQFSVMIPGFKPETVMKWLRGHDEPSERAIAVLRAVTGRSQLASATRELN